MKKKLIGICRKKSGPTVMHTLSSKDDWSCWCSGNSVGLIMSSYEWYLIDLRTGLNINHC